MVMMGFSLRKNQKIGVRKECIIVLRKLMSVLFLWMAVCQIHAMGLGELDCVLQIRLGPSNILDPQVIRCHSGCTHRISLLDPGQEEECLQVNYYSNETHCLLKQPRELVKGLNA